MSKRRVAARQLPCAKHLALLAARQPLGPHPPAGEAVRDHGRPPLPRPPHLCPCHAEGVLYAEKDFNLPKHPEIDVPNLEVIKLMQVRGGSAAACVVPPRPPAPGPQAAAPSAVAVHARVCGGVAHAGQPGPAG